jgi:hypothetical protein
VHLEDQDDDTSASVDFLNLEGCKFLSLFVDSFFFKYILILK